MVIENIGFGRPEEEITSPSAEMVDFKKFQKENKVSEGYNDRYEKIYAELRSLKEIVGSSRSYSPDEVIESIRDARDVVITAKDMNSFDVKDCIQKITNGGELKIRDRVIEILEEELAAINALEYSS